MKKKKKKKNKKKKNKKKEEGEEKSRLLLREGCVPSSRRLSHGKALWDGHAASSTLASDLPQCHVSSM